MRRVLLLAFLLAGIPLLAQITGDVIGTHDLSPGSKSPITGARPGSCSYCHAPHSGLATGIGAVEPDADQGHLSALHQHHLSPEGPAAGPGFRQQFVFELPRWNGRRRQHDCFRADHDDGFHEHSGCAGDEPAELASFQLAVAHQGHD